MIRRFFALSADPMIADADHNPRTSIHSFRTPLDRPHVARCFTDTWPQDTSAPRHFGTYIWCRSVALVPKCLKTFREGAAGQQQANRTQTCPCGPMCSGPCPAASPHYANCAACVGRHHKRYYCRWSSRWCCRAWTMATRRSPSTQLDRLQSVMNAAARLVCSAQKYELITPLLRDFQWLQMPERIEFKPSVLVFRCLHGPYLAIELRRVADVDTRGCDLRRRLPFITPSSCRTTIGDRVFFVAAPRAWNTLPSSVTV